ncbi:MAG: hypothetical protein FD143_3249 [Ignavibacteria bacterium]|nr:MAG: hypothetical protein FD143_3249 [Ignavibacteria bacterium]
METLTPVQYWGLISIISTIGCVVVALGLVFGPLAFMVALTAGKQCPQCKFWVPKDATVCGHCTKEIK